MAPGVLFLNLQAEADGEFSLPPIYGQDFKDVEKVVGFGGQTIFAQTLNAVPSVLKKKQQSSSCMACTVTSGLRLHHGCRGEPTMRSRITGTLKSHLRKRMPNKTGILQSNPPSKSTDTRHTVPPVCHMAELDCTRVEIEKPEAKLSVDPMLLSPETGISDCNNVLCEWGSGVEDAFQKNTDLDMAVCAIPTPKPIKFEPDSVVTVQEEGPHFAVISTTSESSCQGVKEHRRIKDEKEELTNVSKSQNSYKAEDASDITLDLLLDFPNDGEYLQYV